MPYYVYKISPGPTDLVKNLELLDQFEKYRDAKTFIRGQRNESDDDTISTTRMILAENPLEAEEKLLEKREKPVLMEWEK